MAAEYKAINLSQGFPDFDVSPEIIELVYNNMKKGHNQYAPMPGLPQLREVIAHVIKTTYQHSVDPGTDITITSGATEALFASITAIVQAGDEVIVFDPAYDSYAPAIKLSGGIPVHINLTTPTFSIDWNQVKKAINEKTKLIIINSPHNPTGTTLSAEDMNVLQKLVSDHGLYVISDEVYERIIFDDIPHESVLKYEELAKRSIAIFSFGKTFHATGWKVGYAVAPPSLSGEIRKMHQYLTFSVNTPVQHALASYMQEPEHYESLGKFYQQKRDYFIERLKDSKFEILPCHGTYFQLLSYKNIADISEMEMAEHITKTFGVASIPTSSFYKTPVNNHVLRFCFAKSEETIDQAAEILCKI